MHPRNDISIVYMKESSLVVQMKEPRLGMHHWSCSGGDAG